MVAPTYSGGSLRSAVVFECVRGSVVPVVCMVDGGLSVVSCLINVPPQLSSTHPLKPHGLAEFPLQPPTTPPGKNPGKAKNPGFS